MSKNYHWGADLIVPGLYVGSSWSSRNLEPLQEAGITHVVNAARELPNRFREHFHYLHVKLVDNTYQNIIEILPDVTKYIAGAISSGGCVLAHCAGGSSRSGALAVAFLMSLDLPENQSPAIAEVVGLAQERRPIILPNPGFMEQLQTFKDLHLQSPAGQQLKEMQKKYWRKPILEFYWKVSHDEGANAR